MGAKPSLPSEPLARGSIFETLSNDVLLELFDYFSSHEIYLSFAHLNYRLVNLIHSYPQHVNFQSSQIISPYIRSLKITGRNQLPLFFSLHISQLSTIRGITVGNLQVQQVLDMLNVIELEQLEYFYFGVCRDDSNANDLVESVQTKILALGEYRLRRCHLRGHLFINNNNLPLLLPALEYIHLDGCKDFSILSSFLSRTPNLNFLRVSLLGPTRDPLQSVSCRLTRLILRLHSDCSISELRIFFATCCSYLEKLIVQPFTRNYERSNFMISKQQWTNILPTRVIWFHLKKMIDQYHCVPFNNTETSKLYDTIWLIQNEDDSHSCQVIIEEPFSSVW